MRQPRRECRTGHAFSLVELVIVVVIIGVIASIAVPRMSSAAANAEANALEATLAGVRKAIDLYYAEHGKYPGYAPATGLRNDENFVKQLLMYTDESGNMNAAPSTTFRFGPYLRKPFPKNPTNGLSTVFVKAAPGEATPAADTCGWVAVLSHGYFGINATATELKKIGVVEATAVSAMRGAAVELGP